MVGEIKICKYKTNKQGDWKIGLGVDTSRGFYIYDSDFVLEKTVYDYSLDYCGFSLDLGLVMQHEIEKLKGEDIIKAHLYSDKGDNDYKADKDKIMELSCSLFNKDIIQLYSSNILDGSYRFILYQDDNEIGNRVVNGNLNCEFKANESIKYKKGTCFRFELLDKDKIIIAASYKYDK